MGKANSCGKMDPNILVSTKTARSTGAANTSGERVHSMTVIGSITSCRVLGTTNLQMVDSTTDNGQQMR